MTFHLVAIGETLIWINASALKSDENEFWLEGQ
jgi:hypothetical protein